MADTYYQGETIKIKATIKDEDGTLTDPTTITVTIEDPNGTKQVDGATMTKESTGVYCYYYTLADDAVTGLWTIEVEASSGYPSIEQDTFRVVSAL